MEGPRAVRAEEMRSLSELVDTVFRGTPADVMFTQYPQLFNATNLHNLLVFVDGERVVSHYGMVQRWACLGGCTVRVACVGSVATYEQYRGRKLASQLLEASTAKALSEGVDIVMISGGRGLYRRNGAVDYGVAVPVKLGPVESARLGDPALSVRDMTDDDIGACALLYAQRASRFVRPADDWTWFLQSRRAMNRACRGLVVCSSDTVCGYVVIAEPDDSGVGRVQEFAGSERIIAGALPSVIGVCGLQCVQFHLQETDGLLRCLLEGAGAETSAPAMSCTLLLLNFPQLMERLRPWFEVRAGIAVTRDMTFRHPEQNIYVFACGKDETRIEGRDAAAEFIFRSGPEPVRVHPWNKVFPAPDLWYGLNYA